MGVRADEKREAGDSPQPAAVPCLFSKPLSNRPWADLPGVLNNLGVTAVDLTCRPGGHVLPERAAQDLPRAYETLTKAGIAVPMVTTAITEAGKDHADTIVRTVAELGIRYIKLGYYPYGDLRQLDRTLADVKSRLRDIAAMCRSHHVQAGFHNHSGSNVGAAMWDLWSLLEGLPGTAIGSYFDVYHATVEGGKEGWRIGLARLAPRIIMVSVKDFVWKRGGDGRWRVETVPLGEGMVQLEPALRQIKAIPFEGPISLHIEYGRRGQPVGSDDDQAILAGIRKDWTLLTGTLKRLEMLPS
jgi:sugar phosphate isomerase/epimerase